MKNIGSYIFRKIDIAIVKLAGWSLVPESNVNLMYMNPYRYKGESITLKDGTVIKNGDWIAELHLNNRIFGSLDTSYANLIRLFKSEMKSIGKCISCEPYSKIKAVYATTVFYEIAERQGFTVMEIKSSFKRFFYTLWENILRMSYKKNNKKRKNKIVTPKEIWISQGQIAY